MTRPIPGEPVAATELWRSTVRAAKLRCECAGTCGKKHAKTAGQCDNGLHKAARTLTRDDRLHVTLRGTRHVAMCGECTDGHTRTDKRAAREQADDLLEAYALPGLGLNDHAEA